uniref:Secreted protein n=1 Tax=Pediastrum duplex TaxID=3105 RepID=A0A2U8GJ48_PEDDU|nr:hypothetical protein [Pediastrum duplex]
MNKFICLIFSLICFAPFTSSRSEGFFASSFRLLLFLWIQQSRYLRNASGVLLRLRFASSSASVLRRRRRSEEPSQRAHHLRFASAIAERNQSTEVKKLSLYCGS